MDIFQIFKNMTTSIRLFVFLTVLSFSQGSFAQTEGTETGPECSNGIDDDGDGFIDGDDFDCAPLSLNNLTMENSIKIYPNPTHDILKIINYKEGLKIESVILYNIEGKVIQLIPITNNDEIEIDLSQFARHVYFLSISSNFGKINKLIIKK